MTPREWCTVSLVTGLMCMILPFARANPFEPFSEVWATVTLFESLWFSTETPFSVAANCFIIGVLLVYFHSGASLIMAGALGYAAYVSFVGQSWQPAFGFYVSLGATLVGLYAFYKMYLAQHMPRKRRVVYASDLWV